MSALDRILAPIKRKIFLLFGRAIVSYINDSEQTQKVQLKLLADEVATDVERFEEYGFSSYPLTDSQAIAAFINGNRDHGIVICVHDRRYRPQDLSEGDVAIYTSQDKTSSDHRIHLKSGKGIELLTNIALGVGIGLGRKLADERLLTAYNAHTHTQANDSNGDTQVPTGVPVVPLTLSGEFTSNVEAL